MTRSDYEIVLVQEDKIFLVDLDLGNRSVTNDAEAVAQEINKNFPGRRIIYRDSLGHWDEIVIPEIHNRDAGQTIYRYADFAPYIEAIPEFNITGCPSSELLRT